MSLKDKPVKIILILILLGSFIVRLYKINNPVADWHSWRQADTAAVARNFIKLGFTPLYPRYDDLSNVQSGKDNPQGYRMVEFPLYQIMGYFLYRSNPKLSIELNLRLVSIFFSMISLFFLYSLVRKYDNELTAILTASIFGFLPYSIYYSRSILPEMTAVGLALGAIYVLDKVFENIKRVSVIKYYVLSIISALLAASALLVKPTVGFLLLPIGYIFFKKNKAKVLIDPIFYIYGLVTLLPLVLWRKWILQFPEGIPYAAWLFNSGNIRFTGAFFRWIIGERLSKLILGYTGLFLFVLGLIMTTARKSFIFGSIFLGTILYVIIFAAGNVRHDYYQILLIPIVAIYSGRGIACLISGKLKINKAIGYSVAVAMFISMLAFSWYEVRGYYWINHPEIVEVGRKVDALIPKDAKVIAPYGGDTAFLYQTNRQGWPVIQRPIPEMIRMGADYLVVVNPDTNAINLNKTYKILEKEEKYIIFDLKNPS